jgi:orotidine-5'-phosphate decarboxylase
MEKANSRLIIALDVPTLEDVTHIVDTVGDLVDCYKVGMEAFYGMGHTVLAQLASRNKKVFVDLKLHDIPTTVSKTVKALCQFSPAFITLHAAGGVKMLKAAMEEADIWAARYQRPRPKLLAITVLTSLGERDWVEIGYQSPIRESVLRMAVMCKEAGMDGVVAAPQEASAIRALCGSDFLIVTPGIRLQPERNGDQTRTATPAQALKAGAHYLVVGRPILSVADPRKEVTSILQDMNEYMGKPKAQ